MSTYRSALLLCGFAAVALFIAGTRPWTASGLTGDDIAPLLTSLPLVAAAGIAGLIATAQRRRTMVALILLAAPLFGLVDWLFGVNVSSEDAQQPLVWIPWPALALTGALAMVVSGSLGLRYGAQWPQLGTRYDREEKSAQSDWQRLDHGEDPTL